MHKDERAILERAAYWLGQLTRIGVAFARPTGASPASTAGIRHIEPDLTHYCEVSSTAPERLGPAPKIRRPHVRALLEIHGWANLRMSMKAIAMCIIAFDTPMRCS